MHKRERSVGFYDFTVDSSTRKEYRPKQMAPSLAAEIAFSVWKRSRPITFNDGEIQISLEDWQYAPFRNEYYLLFNRADPTQSDVPFKNVKNGRTRMAEKTDDEGIDLSTHVVLKIGAQNREKPVLLMTGGAGLSAAKMATALSRLLRQGAFIPEYKSHYICPHPGGAKDKILAVSHQISLPGHQSAYLQNILRGGTLEGIELISEEARRLDSDFTITSTVIRCEPSTPHKAGGFSLKSIRNAIGSTDQPISKARVIFKEFGEKNAKSQIFPINDLEKAFVKRERIVFESDIFPRYTSINHGIIDKLRNLL